MRYIFVFLFLYISSFYLSGCDSRETESIADDIMYKGRIELAHVSIAITSMQGSSWPLVMDLENDKRIVGFVGISDKPTNDMTNDGLIRIKESYLNRAYYSDYINEDMEDVCDGYIIESGSICPPCVFLQMDKTKFYYTVDAEGIVYGYLDSNGVNPIVSFIDR